MTTQTMISHDKATTLQLLEALFLPENLEGIRVRLWDDSFWPEYGEANTTLVLNYPGSLRAMLLPGTELWLADGKLVPIYKTLVAAKQVGFETRDVESLREHYVLTLRHWVVRLEKNHDHALQFVDEHTYRVWRLYMSGSIHGFKTRRLNVYQSLFVKPGDNGDIQLPLTRIDWYKN